MSHETSHSKRESQEIKAPQADEPKAMSQQEREAEWQSFASEHSPDEGQRDNIEAPDREKQTELQLDETYAAAPAAKAEIDALADDVAKETDGKAAKAPLKDRERAMQKATADYDGDASKVKDIARNTVVVEQGQYHNAVERLRERGATIKTIEPENNPMGYSGTNAVVKTEAGIYAEIQVNTPEMIYANQSPDRAKALLGEEKYAEIADKTGVPGGRGHLLYERYRTLPDGDPRAKELEADSQQYYNKIREKYGEM